MRRSTRQTALIALVWAALPVAAIAQSAGVDALLNQAHYWQAKGRRDLAGQAYRRVLQVDPNNAAARQGLAAINAPPAVASKPPQAKPAAKTPVATSTARAASISPPPSHTRASADRAGDARAAGYHALDAGDLDEAAAHFNAAINANSRDGDAVGGLGLTRLRAGRFDEARDLLMRASKLGASARWADALASARFYGDLGDARKALDTGDVAGAQAKAERLANSGFKDRGPALQLLAQIYAGQGRYGDASDLYRLAGASANGDTATSLQAQAVHARAMQAAASGNTVLAQELFQNAIAGSPQDPWLRYDYAKFLDQQGRGVEASDQVAALSRASDPQSLYAAALLMHDANQPLQAAALLASIPEQERTPQMNNLALTLKTDEAITRARTLRMQGRGTSADASLQQLGAIPGLAAGAKAQIAGALLEFGDTAGAGAVAQDIALDEVEDVGSLDPLIRLFAKTGQDAQMAAAFQRATALAGASPSGQQEVAQLGGVMTAAQAGRLQEAGQFAQAFDLLQAQWAQSPGNIDVLTALAHLYQAGAMYPQAQQTFQMALAQKPDDKGVLIGLMDSAASTGDFHSADTATAQALRVAPADYEVYLAAARVAQARGDKKNAYRYLDRAKQLYAQQTGMAPGGFPGSNPFAGTPSGNPFRAAALPSAVNPFALGKEKPASLAANGYAPMAYTSTPSAISAPPGFATQAAAYSPQPSYLASAPGMSANSAPASMIAGQTYAPMQAGTQSDPVLAGIQRDMQALAGDTGTRLDADTHYRQRTGETGLSELRELGGSADVSTNLGDGRISAKADAVVVDAGRPTGSGLARFGRNATPEAEGIVAQKPSQLVQADAQHASGIALSVAYEDKTMQADVGTTPLGFQKTNITGGVSVSPHLSPHSTLKIYAERRPVTDGVVSYAGTRDPVTGAFWGAVMHSGGGAAYSYDKDGAGFYADASYHHLDGTNVPANQQIEANAGAYLPVIRHEHSSLTLGINANYQDYKNNQNFFTFGQGGYFSPQSFLSISFPVRYQSQKGPLSINAQVAPGYQSYDQQAEPVYPTDPAAQAELDSLKQQDTDVRSFYDSISKTGFGLAGSGSLYYSLASGTRIGGQVDYNSFGDYNEFKATIGIRRSLGGNQ